MRAPLAALALVVSPSAYALTFDEVGGGDLFHDESNPRWLGALASGRNTVRGNVTDRGDTFAFDLNPGMSVLGARMSVVNLVDHGDYAYGWFYRPSPIWHFDPTFAFSDGTYELPVDDLLGEARLAFTASSTMGAATYIWTLEMDVGRPCAGGTQRYHEVLDGDLPDSEASAADLGALGAGAFVWCGDGLDEDAAAFSLAPQAEVVSVDVVVESFPSTPGANAVLTLFDPATLTALDAVTVLGVGTYPLDLSAAGGLRELGVSTGAIVPAGVAYDYRVVVEIERPPPQIVDTHPTAGATHTFRMAGFTPGANVHLLAGTSPGSVAVPGCAGQSVGIRQPRVLGPTRAQADGTVAVTVPIPAALSGVRAYLQAVELGSCSLSQVAAFDL